MKRFLKYLIYFIFGSAFLPIWFLLLVPVIFISRIKGLKKNQKPKLLWGGKTPIITHAFWSQAMKEVGYDSETISDGFFSKINSREDWDKIVDEHYTWVVKPVRLMLLFLEVIIKYDVFFMNFDGHLLGETPLWRLQAYIFKLANKKTVLFTFGGDFYTYRRIRSTSLIHGLLMIYGPRFSRKQDLMASRIDYWTKHADAVIPGFMGPEGLGRWDALIPSCWFIDMNLWNKSQRNSLADGANECVRIVHSPNHRGFKGTEFIIDSVEQLKKEGLKVELVLIEGVQNKELRKIFENDVDIHVEQIIATGFGLNGAEGMASGLPVLCNLEDSEYILPFKRWSYFSECPIVSVTPENLTDTLRTLVKNPKLRHELGKANREYAEKYHSYKTAQYLFSETINFLYGKRESLINLFHPLLGEYDGLKNKVKHPLINNKIVNE